jgi:DNA repair photolyase
VAPVLPGLSDRPDQLDDVVGACVEAGAASISTVLLHQRPGVREVYLAHLGETHPHLVPEVRRRYRDRAYAPRADQQALATRVRDLVRAHGGLPAERGDPEHMTGRRPGPAPALPSPSPAADQLRLL